MKITVLGSASGLPAANRNSSAYWVQTSKQAYLIDAGDGVARQLVRYGLNPNQLNCVFISHMHSDHVTGLFMLLQLMHQTGRTEPFHVYLPESVLPDFEQVFPYFQIFKEKWPYVFHCSPISKGQFFKEENFTITAVPNQHLSKNQVYAQKTGVGTDCYSFFFGENRDKMVIYTSDIDSFDHLAESDLKSQCLISECTHVDAETVCHYAKKNNISKIVCSHIHPDYDKIKNQIDFNSFSFSFQFANDGDSIEV